MDDHEHGRKRLRMNNASDSIHFHSFADEPTFTSSWPDPSFISVGPNLIANKAPADSLRTSGTKLSSIVPARTGTRKPVEVIDLTGDSDLATEPEYQMPSDVHLMPRAPYHSDGQTAKMTHLPASSTHAQAQDEASRLPSMFVGTQQQSDDEAFARMLQAEFDKADYDPVAHSPSLYNNHGIDHDASYARLLQAEFNKADYEPVTYSPGLYNNHGIDHDASYARLLHAEYENERDFVSTFSHGKSQSLATANFLDYPPRPTRNYRNQEGPAPARQLHASHNEERSVTSASSPGCPQQPAIDADLGEGRSITTAFPFGCLQQSATNVDFENNDKAVLQFAKLVRQVGCAGCGSLCLSSEHALQLKFKQWFEVGAAASVALSSIMACEKRSCAAQTCLGCGSLWKKGAYSAIVLPDKSTIQWCCDQGRLALLWLLLCGHDRRRTSAIRRDSFFKKSKISAEGSGVGYGGSEHLGHAPNHYASTLPGPSWNPLTKTKYGTLKIGGSYAGAGALAPFSTLTQEGKIMVRMMHSLAILLPSPTVSQGFDLDPPAVLISLLTQSHILNSIATLLRNDSLEDATMKFPLYSNTLDVVGKLGSHQATIGVAIHGKRRVQEHGPDLLSRSFGSSNLGEIRWEEQQPLAECLRNFDKQSKNILRHSQAHTEAFSGPENQQMLSLCQRVSDLADRLLVDDSTTVPGLANQNNKDWHADMAVLEVPDDSLMSRHHYANQAATVENRAVNRMKSLSLQMSNLMTSLPPGIFVRHRASRLDVMKILIVGPKDTPYEGGLFEFDLFCPSGFPNQPPMMNLRTTGGGSVRFNPNLYSCGKVCLSLLGTWSGEPWQPGKSTILQVLVSIQAMIFCDEPWYNEPGRGNPGKASSGRNSSMRYNREIQGYTVQHAMINWLEPSNLDPIWGDVIRKHFTINGDEILRNVDSWGVKDALRAQLKKCLFDMSSMDMFVRAK